MLKFVENLSNHKPNNVKKKIMVVHENEIFIRYFPDLHWLKHMEEIKPKIIRNNMLEYSAKGLFLNSMKICG